MDGDLWITRHEDYQSYAVLEVLEVLNKAPIPASAADKANPIPCLELVPKAQMAETSKPTNKGTVFTMDPAMWG
jgi:hypothetical protein